MGRAFQWLANGRARFGASPLDNFRNHWRLLAIASFPFRPRNALHFFRNSPHPFKDLRQKRHTLFFGEQGGLRSGPQGPQERGDPNEHGDFKRDHARRNPPVEITHHPFLHESVIDGLESSVESEPKQNVSFHSPEPYIVAAAQEEQGEKNDDDSKVQAALRSQQEGDYWRTVSQGSYQGIEHQSKRQENKPTACDCPDCGRGSEASPAQFSDGQHSCQENYAE